MQPLIDSNQDFQHATKTLGDNFVRWMAVEECGEFLSAMNNENRGKGTLEEVLEEGCDALICIYNVLIVNFTNDEIDSMLEKKLNKMRSKIYIKADQ